MHAKHIIGVLGGWNRIVFRGTLRLVANLAGMCSYLSYRSILMKDFKQYALDKTARLIQASVAKAEQAGRPNVYLHSSRTNKEQVALDIAARDGLREGLICILRTVEPCMTYKLHKNRRNKTLDLELFQGKCNNARAFRVYRRSERDPEGPEKMLPMSKGIADLYARSQISGQVNERYLDALAQLDTTERIQEVVSPICRRHLSKGKSIRALRPWSEADQQLLTAVAECGLAGDFRNRDLAGRLYPNRPAKEVSAKVTYLLRLLREHKIIRRLPKTRKYRLTPNGAKIIATIFLTQKAATEQRNKAAA